MKGIVVDNVTPEMSLFREESFGPQVSITRVSSAEEAVRLANETDYGLSAAIFSRDVARAIELAKRIESGICHINGPTVHDEAQMPFGGVKASGYGRRPKSGHRRIHRSFAGSQSRRDLDTIRSRAFAVATYAESPVRSQQMSLEDRDGHIWLDGRLIAWRDARVHILSYTFQHGAGVFEGTRACHTERGTSVFLGCKIT